MIPISAQPIRDGTQPNELRTGLRAGSLLARPSAFRIAIHSKPNAQEGDYFIKVYLDENYRVVGKDAGEYQK